MTNLDFDAIASRLVQDKIARLQAQIDSERDAQERARVKRDVNEFYNARRMARRERVIVRYPTLTPTAQVVWHDVAFDSRLDADGFIRRHNIVGASVENALLAGSPERRTLALGVRVRVGR